MFGTGLNPISVALIRNSVSSFFSKTRSAFFHYFAGHPSKTNIFIVGARKYIGEIYE
jgi:hypothetical protein